MGSIVPPLGQRPACAQVYILDGEAQVAARCGLPWGSRLDVDVLKGLTDMLMAVNPFVQHFRCAADDDAPELHLRIMPSIILAICFTFGLQRMFPLHPTSCDSKSGRSSHEEVVHPTPSFDNSSRDSVFVF
jgi:hypothetical protein